MTITPDQARALLNGASPGPWDEDTSNILNSDGDGLLSDWSFGDPHWYNARDIALMAAAPDLAETVIDQGKRIEELEAQNAALRSTDTSEWGY